MAGLLVAGSGGAVMAAEGSPQLGPVKTKPGRPSGEIVVRLPDGRLLHFTAAPRSGSPAPGPSSGQPGGQPSGSPSGQPGGQPSGRPSGAPGGTPSGPPSGWTGSGTPVPVVSSLFPSSSASGSPSGRKPSSRPSHSGDGSSDSPAAVVPKRSSTPAQDGQGAAAVLPAAQPELPDSTVPPPLGPHAVLRPDAMNAQVAAPAAESAGAGLAHRGRLLGVGLALIGAGAALFGWRIRRL